MVWTFIKKSTEFQTEWKPTVYVHNRALARGLVTRGQYDYPEFTSGSLLVEKIPILDKICQDFDKKWTISSMVS